MRYKASPQIDWEAVIAEATGLNRRDFLKRSGASLASTLLSQGIPSLVVSKAVAGKPLIAMFSLPAWDPYEVSLIGNFDDAFRSVSAIHAQLKKMGASPVFHFDGEFSAYYSIQLTPEILKNFDVEWVEKDHTDPYQNFYGKQSPHGVLKNFKPPAERGKYRGWSWGDHRPGTFNTIDDFDDLQFGPMHTTDQINPFVDFWNSMAKYDAQGVSKNAGFVKRLHASFGDKLDELQIIKNEGSEVVSLSWDKFDDFAENPEKYLADDEEYLADNEPKEEPESEPQPEVGDWTPTTPFPEAGGLAESIEMLCSKIHNGDITLVEALDWTKRSGWPRDAQQQLAVRYVERTMVEALN
jgi:hypothetical protein